MLNCSRVEQGGLNPEKKMIKKRKFVEKRCTKKMAANLFSRISSSSLMELAPDHMALIRSAKLFAILLEHIWEAKG